MAAALAAISALSPAAGAYADSGVSTYHPSEEVRRSQREFSADRFGIFIHWGIYSMFGQGEWYLNYGPKADEYAKAAKGFYPADFDADAFDFASTPRGKAADSEVKVSEKELTVTRHEFLPGITVGATAQALIKGFNPYNVDRSRFEQGNFMGFEVGITVPLFFGAQRSRAKAAKKDVEIARMQRESAEKESKNEYNAALDRLKAASANLAYYTVDGSAQAAEIARIADVSYRLGEIDYVEYISNLETAYEMQSGYADAINEYNQTVILLNYLTGKISDR